MKTLKERVLSEDVRTIRLTGAKFLINKKIIKEHGVPIEVEEILFELKVSDLIPLLKSMANSHGYVHGRISPMKEPNENISHIGLLCLPSKTSSEDAH